MNKIILEDINNLLNNDYPLEKLKGKNIFIAGGNSQISKYLTYFLLEANVRNSLNMNFIVLVRNEAKAKINYKDYLNKAYFSMLVSDITDPINIESDVDIIIHSGGSSSPYHYLNDPVGIIKANALGTLNILELARKKNVEKVLFFSTREVYGEVDSSISEITEDDIGKLDPSIPRNCYPESKKLAESAFVAYAQQYNIPFVILRIASAYGPGMMTDNDGRAIADLVKAVVDKKNIVLNSAGTAVRSYCYMTDITDGILHSLLAEESNQFYNLANENDQLQIREMAFLLEELYREYGVKVEFANAEDNKLKGAYNTAEYVPLNMSKLKTLGWKPKVRFKEGIQRTIESFWI